MEMRETLLVLMCFALGPLLVLLDGGIKTDIQLRSENLVPIASADTTSLDLCRSRVKYYHYCRHHVTTETEDVIFRYRFFARERESFETFQYLRSSESDKVTTSFGQKYLWHRILLIAFITIAALIKAAYELWKYFAPAKRSSKSLNPNQYVPDRPMPVRRSSAKKSFGKR